MRELGRYLIAKPRNAGIIAFLFAALSLYSPLGAFISGIIVAIVTLGRGTVAGLIVLAWVAIPAVCFLLLHKMGNYYAVFVYDLVVWILAIFLLKQKSWRSLFEFVSVIGVLIVVAVHLFMPNIQVWWVEHLHQPLLQAKKAYNFGISDAQLLEFAQYFSAMATGSYVLAFFMLGGLLQVVIGRCWQLSIDKRHTLLEEFSQIRFGHIAAALLLAAFIGVLMKSPVITDIFPLVLLPFLASGLGMMHLYAKSNRGILVLLVMVYIGFVCMPILSVIVLAGLGFVDSWVNFRGNLPLNMRRT